MSADSNLDTVMDPILTKIIEQLNSSVFVLLLVLVAVGYMLHKAGEWKQTFVHHKDKITELEELSREVIKISTKVDLIYSNTTPNAMTRAHSPISLTAVGIETAKRLNAEAMLDKYYVQLKKQLDSSNPQNAYDIQKYAMQVAKSDMTGFIDASELNAIKDEAFNKGVLLEDIFSIFGVLLRDKVLKEKGISVTEVDDHAPK